MQLPQTTIDKVGGYIRYRNSAYDFTGERFNTAVDIASDRYSNQNLKNYYQILGLYILHMDECSGSGNSGGSSNAGSVVSTSEGGISIGLGKSATLDVNGDLSRTGWGIELSSLIRTSTMFTAFNCNM